MGTGIKAEKPSPSSYEGITMHSQASVLYNLLQAWKDQHTWLYIVPLAHSVLVFEFSPCVPSQRMFRGEAILLLEGQGWRAHTPFGEMVAYNEGFRNLSNRNLTENYVTPPIFPVNVAINCLWCECC